MSYTYSFINKNTAITVPINAGIVRTVLTTLGRQMYRGPRYLGEISQD